MRSYTLAALALFVASTANAGHGQHKARSNANECNPYPSQQTVTQSYVLYPGRGAIATGTSSKQATSTMVTSSKATSTKVTSIIVTSTKSATTSSKPATTSKASTSSAKLAITTTKITTVPTTTPKPATTTTKAAATSKPATTSKPVTTSKPATTSTTSSKPPAATNTGGSGSGSPAFAAEILAAHNAARLPRNAKALTWSTEAEALAKTWAEKCIWQHGGNPNMGQNLAASAGFKQNGAEVVGAWMSEEKDYNPASPSYSHFTQVVWKSTTAVGCYQATCTKMVMPDGSEVFPNYSPSYMTVCNYSPPGNFVGQAPQNVDKLA